MPEAARIAIVVSQFNAEITKSLLEGAMSVLREHGIAQNQIEHHQVPGAFELPFAAEQIARSGTVSVIIALGCVIRGETSHYDHIAAACASGLMQVSVAHALPVVFGVLTTENRPQALARAGGTKGNRGEDAARTALAMLSFMRAFR